MEACAARVALRVVLTGSQHECRKPTGGGQSAYSGLVDELKSELASKNKSFRLEVKRIGFRLVAVDRHPGSVSERHFGACAQTLRGGNQSTAGELLVGGHCLWQYDRLHAQHSLFCARAPYHADGLLYNAYMKKLFITGVPIALSLYIAAIFLDSLRYKFTNHPKTEHIFGTLDSWSGTLGFPGAFSHSGIFSQYVIGSVELLAAALVLLGLLPRLRKLSLVGSGIAFVIMSGALFFHLFTPLGIDPNHDGGGLFVAAVLLWCASIVLIGTRMRELHHNV